MAEFAVDSSCNRRARPAGHLHPDVDAHEVPESAVGLREPITECASNDDGDERSDSVTAGRIDGSGGQDDNDGDITASPCGQTDTTDTEPDVCNVLARVYEGARRSRARHISVCLHL